MATPAPLELIGGTGSPYTRKMLALLRYRRIPYAVTWGQPAEVLAGRGMEAPRPTLLPTFLFDDAGQTRAVCDSTPIIRRLESLYRHRAVIPADPALAFVDYLVEDFGDEWCTKYMFHYRWYPGEDAANAGRLLPLTMNITLPPDAHRSASQAFAERQIGRLYVVGSNETTAPVIDASYRRFLEALETLLAEQPCLLGSRPGAGDFALYGQLTQLVGFDPTPRAIAHEVSPRTVAWVDRMEDLSGLEPGDGDWCSLERAAAGLRALLEEIGRVYVPALLANAVAREAGEPQWETTIDGAPWRQQTFPYQVKCLTWIREQYRALGDCDRARVDAVLAGTGCAALFAGD
jgi:glutathione S-transferase